MAWIYSKKFRIIFILPFMTRFLRLTRFSIDLLSRQKNPVHKPIVIAASAIFSFNFLSTKKFFLFPTRKLLESNPEFKNELRRTSKLFATQIATKKLISQSLLPASIQNMPGPNLNDKIMLTIKTIIAFYRL